MTAGNNFVLKIIRPGESKGIVYINVIPKHFYFFHDVLLSNISNIHLSALSLKLVICCLFSFLHYAIGYQ